MNAKYKKWREQYEPIYFTVEDFGDKDREHDEPMVILVLLHNFLDKWVLVYQRSSTKILYSHIAEAHGLQKVMYKLYSSILIRFVGGQV